MSETIREYLMCRGVQSHTRRLAVLAGIGAPQVILEREQELIDEAAAGAFKFKRFEEFKDCVVVKAEIVTGRGGKKHTKFTLADGRVIGLFNGPWSRFFKEWKEDL